VVEGGCCSCDTSRSWGCLWSNKSCDFNQSFHVKRNCWTCERWRHIPCDRNDVTIIQRSNWRHLFAQWARSSTTATSSISRRRGIWRRLKRPIVHRRQGNVRDPRRLRHLHSRLLRRLHHPQVRRRRRGRDRDVITVGRHRSQNGGDSSGCRWRWNDAVRHASVRRNIGTIRRIRRNLFMSVFNRSTLLLEFERVLYFRPS